MRGSFQPTRPGFSASNAGLRASSAAAAAGRRSQDRGSATSRHLSQSTKAAAAQREDYGPLGLELSKDLDMVQWLQQQLSAQQGPLYSAAAPSSSKTTGRGWNVEPLAASNPPQKAAASAAAEPANGRAKAGPLLKAKTLPMLQMVVGGWKRGSKFEGDLVLKCYFTKKKLCWEILDGNLTYKCEMRWPEIQYLHSRQAEDREFLELDIRQPPSFFEELEPQAKKRAVWKACQDFTGGQVSMGKRQQFTFLPGKLSAILPDFFALNQHLRHDHERDEVPHPGPSELTMEDGSHPAAKSVQQVYTEQEFLDMVAQGAYAYPSELPAELTSTAPSTSQSASCSTFGVAAIALGEQEQSSLRAQPSVQIQEEPMDFLGNTDPARDSLDLDLSDLPSILPPGSLLDSFMCMDSPDLELLQEASSLTFAAQQRSSNQLDGDIIDEIMDWDAMYC